MTAQNEEELELLKVLICSPQAKPSGASEALTDKPAGSTTLGVQSSPRVSS